MSRQRIHAALLMILMLCLSCAKDQIRKDANDFLRAYTGNFQKLYSDTADVVFDFPLKLVVHYLIFTAVLQVE
jgi:hypothetical protein